MRLALAERVRPPPRAHAGFIITAARWGRCVVVTAEAEAETGGGAVLVAAARRHRSTAARRAPSQLRPGDATHCAARTTRGGAAAVGRRGLPCQWRSRLEETAGASPPPQLQQCRVPSEWRSREAVGAVAPRRKAAPAAQVLQLLRWCFWRAVSESSAGGMMSGSSSLPTPQRAPSGAVTVVAEGGTSRTPRTTRGRAIAGVVANAAVAATQIRRELCGRRGRPSSMTSNGSPSQRYIVKSLLYFGA